MKFKHLILLLLAFITFQSCDSSDAYFGVGNNPDEPDTFTRISDFIKFDNVPTDTLAFDPLEDSMLEGRFGVKITIPANSCEGGNPALPEELFVVLREYPTLTKMALSNVQTESNEEMLVTGGNFWWKIIDAEGNDYELVQPSQVSAEQPVITDMGDYAAIAAYYKGEVINAGNQQVTNWNIVQNNESSMGEGNTFEFLGLQLGWANVDVLHDYPGDRTAFSVSLNPNDNLAVGQEMVLLLVDDFPSLINIYTRDGDNFITHPNSIPVGITGNLIGIAITEDNQLMVGSTEITVEGDDTFSIDLSPGTQASLENLLNLAENN